MTAAAFWSVAVLLATTEPTVGSSLEVRDSAMVALGAKKVLVSARITMESQQSGIPFLSDYWGFHEPDGRLVKSVSVRVGSDSVFVPRSAFADLADVRRVEFGSAGEKLVIVLRGGETGFVYTCRYEISKGWFRRRKVGTPLSDANEETFYHPPAYNP